jgi:hypothetical protein
MVQRLLTADPELRQKPSNGDEAQGDVLNSSLSLSARSFLPGRLGRVGQARARASAVDKPGHARPTVWSRPRGFRYAHRAAIWSFSAPCRGLAYKRGRCLRLIRPESGGRKHKTDRRRFVCDDA